MSQILCTHLEYKGENNAARYSYFSRVYLERSDLLFALMGGGPLQRERQPLFALRGMPADANLLTHIAFYLLVREEETDRDRHIARRQAEQWVARGDAQWVGASQITDPDYFGPSWVSAEELTQVHYAYQTHNAPRLFLVEAALAAMRQLPNARLVYWFGN